MNKIDRRRKGLLILECDSEKLTQQNLALGSELENNAKLFFPQNPINLVRSFKETDLLETLGEAHKAQQLYRNVVIICHSNRNGLQISADRFIDWEAAANWIYPFEPHRVILLACEAGQWLPCAALFDGVPSLKEIFGSPITAHKNQQHIVLLRVLHILGAKKEAPELNKLMQLGNFILTKGVMVSRTRSQYECADEESEIWENVTQSLLDHILR